jgi:recombination protein RecA
MNLTPPSAKEKVKALDLALQQIEKQFGKGAIMKLGEESSKVAIDVIPTGSIGLDMALGVGGVPRGRIVEIYGPESSGKTTLALTIISNAQRAGGNAVMIDAEHALDAAYAQKLGVDIANLHVAQPDTGEEALEIADHLVRSGAVDVVVIDSVAALVPRAEIEGEMGDSHVGLQARLMSQALRKLTGSISKSRTTVIFINQIRMQIGVMFGNPETTAGGRALKFYASVRLDIRRIQTLKEGDQAIGNRTKVKVVKNKVAAPFREAEFDILYNEGISREGEIIDFALDKGVIQRSGTWFSFGEERIGQGRENARLFIKEHADIRAQIEAKLLPLLGLKAGAFSSPPTANGAAGEPVASAATKAVPAAALVAANGPMGRPAIMPGKSVGAPARPQPALVAKEGKR